MYRRLAVPTGLTFLLLSLLVGCASVNAPSERSELPAITAKIQVSGQARELPTKAGEQRIKYKRRATVVAQLGQGFGFSYRPRLAEGEISQQTTLPVTITVTHPPLTLADGRETRVTQWDSEMELDKINHGVWMFESERMLVPGSWYLSVDYNGQSLAKRHYVVDIVPTAPQKLTSVCSADESRYLSGLARDHNACCNNNDAHACFNFAWRGVERSGDTLGAALYYGRGCELGDPSACRFAGRLAKDHQQKQRWYSLGCELNDTDSCQKLMD
ncbi:DUF3859 domain-containing protein [Ferrimonas kyonanensis]|uniref:DUF3859 domain-containing protein n=1 Tax=Ferrimonas kyonanensis TaxID=364763 RepID=UPI00042A5B94|nr:DUF3859 domain-containing protein [Ferrimonas kyonanensis]